MQVQYARHDTTIGNSSEATRGLASLEALPREHRHPGLDPWTWTLAMKSEAQKWTEPKSRFSPNLDPSFNSAHGRPSSAAQARTYPSPYWYKPYPHPTSNIQERAAVCALAVPSWSLVRALLRNWHHASYLDEPWRTGCSGILEATPALGLVCGQACTDGFH